MVIRILVFSAFFAGNVYYFYNKRIKQIYNIAIFFLKVDYKESQMVSQIYFLNCLQIRFTQIKHTYNDSAVVNKLPVFWNPTAYLKKKKKKEKKTREKEKEKQPPPSGYVMKYKAILPERGLEFCGISEPST